MHCLNGIRAISTQWVVLGHTFAMYLMLPVRNTVDIMSVSLDVIFKHSEI